MRNNYGINANRLVSLVLNGHLAFCIGAQPVDGTRFSQIGGFEQKLVGIHNGSWHKLWCFRAGKTKHHSLVACTLLALVFIQTCSLNTLIDVGRLGVNHVHNGHGIAVQAKIRVGISDFPCNIAGSLLYINKGVCGNLSTNQNKGGRSKGFTCYVAFWVIA